MDFIIEYTTISYPSAINFYQTLMDDRGKTPFGRVINESPTCPPVGQMGGRKGAEDKIIFEDRDGKRDKPADRDG